jgi:hypothetical protein
MVMAVMVAVATVMPDVSSVATLIPAVMVNVPLIMPQVALVPRNGSVVSADLPAIAFIARPAIGLVLAQPVAVLIKIASIPVAVGTVMPNVPAVIVQVFSVVFKVFPVVLVFLVFGWLGRSDGGSTRGQHDHCQKMGEVAFHE